MEAQYPVKSMLEVAPVSVAIPSFQGGERLLRTLEKITQCNPLPSEILINCDGGWRPDENLFNRFPVPVILLYSDIRIGPGGGRDACIRASSNDLVASFDDDSWPIDIEYFSQAIAIMESIANAVILSPAVYIKEKPIMPQLREVSTAKYYDGCASIHRRSLHLTLPGFVPVPEAYGVEEADLSLQAHAAGFVILSSPSLRAWHDRSLSDHDHEILPWIKNEILLVYLRYPAFAQPWGWWRAWRHVWKNRDKVPPLSLFRSLLESIPHCKNYAHFRHRFRLSQILAHLRQKPRRDLIEPVTNGLKISPASQSRRILYVQYTNPAAYPPLEHSARLLARSGWQVDFIGLQGQEAYSLELAPHLRISEWRVPSCPPGWRQKLHYLKFTLQCFLHALSTRPDWIYVSDTLSSPIGALLNLTTRCKVVYHEHDHPSLSRSNPSAFEAFTMRTRQHLLKAAAVVIAPNQQRLALLKDEVKRQGPMLCVWNTPLKEEVVPSRPCPSPPTHLKLLYHGSIVPDRFPMTYLEALAAAGPGITLRLVGYVSNAFPNYVRDLKAKAEQLGVADQFEFLGPLSRIPLMSSASECDVGLAMLRITNDDINMRHMVGASNKPFDYLSQGLSIVVSPDPEWEKLYVANGCAVSCSLDDVSALTETFHWLRDNPEQVYAMGQRGRESVLNDWSYESQFKPVMDLLANSPM
jgi:GT2 family glycosyltransferase